MMMMGKQCAEVAVTMMTTIDSRDWHSPPPLSQAHHITLFLRHITSPTHLRAHDSHLFSLTSFSPLPVPPATRCSTLSSGSPRQSDLFLRPPFKPLSARSLRRKSVPNTCFARHAHPHCYPFGRCYCVSCLKGTRMVNLRDYGPARRPSTSL